MDEASEAKAVAAFQSGSKCLDSGVADLALPYFMAAAEILPGWAEAWLQVGVCYHRLHRYQHACAAMRRGLEICNWEEAPAVLTYMDTLRETGHLREVIAVADRVSSGPFAHFSALLAGGAMQACEGADAACSFFEQACDSDPCNVLYIYLQAQARNRADRREVFASLSAKLTSVDDEIVAQLHRAQHYLDAPRFQFLNDKVSLHRLLAPVTCKDFWPVSFVLPAEAKLAEAAEGSHQHNSPMWVLKQRVSMGGLGVTVHDSVADAMEVVKNSSSPEQHDFLLQSYVHPIVLLNGHKFSLRIFLVVYSGAPLCDPVFYLPREALLLRAPMQYIAAVGQKYAHVTNQSAAQLVSTAEDLTQDLRDVKESELTGWSDGIENIWACVEKVVRGLLPVASGVLKETFGDFQPERAVLVPKILGLDVVLSADCSDSSGKAWLLEINRHPSLGEKYICARRLKRTVLMDSWRLLLHVQAERQDDSATAASSLPWPETYGCMKRVE